MSLLRTFVDDDLGASALEYIALAALGSLLLLGGTRTIFDSARASINASGTQYTSKVPQLAS